MYSDMDRMVKHKLDDRQTQIAISLYRHLFWADNLRKQFESVLARDREELERRLQSKEIVLIQNC